MPEVLYDAPLIVVPLTNWKKGTTEFMQEVIHRDLIVTQDPITKACRTELHGTVMRYTIKADGTQGPELEGPNMAPYSDKLVGQDDTLCHHDLSNPDTLGDIIIYKGKPAILKTADNNGVMSQAEFDELRNDPAIDSMKQGTQFLWLRDNWKLGLAVLIYKHWATANAFKRYNAPAE